MVRSLGTTETWNQDRQGHFHYNPEGREEPKRPPVIPPAVRVPQVHAQQKEESRPSHLLQRAFPPGQSPKSNALLRNYFKWTPQPLPPFRLSVWWVNSWCFFAFPLWASINT